MNPRLRSEEGSITQGNKNCGVAFIEENMQHIFKAPGWMRKQLTIWYKIKNFETESLSLCLEC